jgi:hypothetical protein
MRWTRELWGKRANSQSHPYSLYEQPRCLSLIHLEEQRRRGRVGRLWWLLNGGGKSESLLERSEPSSEARGMLVRVHAFERSEKGVSL